MIWLLNVLYRFWRRIVWYHALRKWGWGRRKAWGKAGDWSRL